MHRMALTLIAETSKDFTLIVNIQEQTYEGQDVGVSRVKQELVSNEGINSSLRHFEIVLENCGKRQRFFARVGIVDLEFKMYTKLSTYAKQWEAHLSNFLDYIK